MSIPEFSEIIEPNDQTEARREHLEKLREIVVNVYPNKFERSNITGEDDTITRVVEFAAPIKDKHIPNLAENEKPTDEQREAANAELNQLHVRVAGRLAVPPRVMGKAAFVHLSDGVSRLQIYVRKQDAVAISNDTGKPIEEEGKAWELFNLLDHGDFIGVSGFLFVTKTGELSIHVETIQFLAKAMLPMPDKMHGIEDAEIKQRQRYADLIASSLKIDHEENELTTRQVFEIRSKIIREMRRFLDDAGYIEVETPMLTPKATGAAARAFETFHEALKIPLYARIAPELYLKRLIVGGFEKVYELNRNFRNEGISTRHNPEFTMLEFYCAYMDVNGMMDFCEKMLKESVQKATGNLQVKYGENEIDFSKFERLAMKEAIVNYFRKYLIPEFEISWLDDKVKVVALSWSIERLHRRWNHIVLGSKDANKKLIIKNFDERFEESEIKEHLKNNWFVIPSSKGGNDIEEDWRNDLRMAEFSIEANEMSDKEIEETLSNLLRNVFNDSLKEAVKENISANEQEKKIVDIFELSAEKKLGIIQKLGRIIVQPTFIIDYPKSVSPLSKASPENPNIAERFELFINGMECANGFSELNDPKEQYERFRDQMKERETGDEEAMVMDEDYIRALAYGMPPAAGIGIGIDRLVMLLTNKHSIRDVILFPHMRPERKNLTAEDAESAEEN
ncbi:MAG: lysine--tRNA ligase [Acidobacteria bacterium]|nr:lysine--tRNA ligase [Acidobacteriota bacterium]